MGDSAEEIPISRWVGRRLHFLITLLESQPWRMGFPRSLAMPTQYTATRTLFADRSHNQPQRITWETRFCNSTRPTPCARESWGREAHRAPSTSTCKAPAERSRL